MVSEGAVRVETEGPVYYGSTSVLLATSVYGGVYASADRDTLVRLVEADPHARVRAVELRAWKHSSGHDNPLDPSVPN